MSRESEREVMNTFMEDYLADLVPVSFTIQTENKQVQIGHDTPEFKVTMKKEPDKQALKTSTSLALGEAYMKGDLDVDRDLYEVLDIFLGQMGKFTRDMPALKKLLITSRSMKNQKKEVQSHYDMGNDFYKLWLDETMSYSCGYFKVYC